MTEQEWTGWDERGLGVGWTQPLYKPQQEMPCMRKRNPKGIQMTSYDSWHFSGIKRKCFWRKKIEISSCFFFFLICFTKTHTHFYTQIFMAQQADFPLSWHFSFTQSGTAGLEAWQQCQYGLFRWCRVDVHHCFCCQSRVKNSKCPANRPSHSNPANAALLPSVLL